MKIEEIDIPIFVSNEEHDLLETLEGVRSYSSFNEREQTLLDGLIRKGIVKRGMRDSQFLVKRNEEAIVRT